MSKYTAAQANAIRRYMARFVEIKVRMTPKRRSTIKAHAAAMEESVSQFINRAIDNQIERDNLLFKG